MTAPPKPTDQDRAKARYAGRFTDEIIRVEAIAEATATARAEGKAEGAAEQLKRDIDTICGGCRNGIPLDAHHFHRPENVTAFFCPAAALRAAAIERETT